MLSRVDRACYDTTDKQDVESVIKSVEDDAQKAAAKLGLSGRLTLGFEMWQK